MILMARQGGAARESLLTVGIWAFVRTLARVDASVARQGTRVAERLLSRSGFVTSQAVLASYLSAALTHVRLLASVNTLMNSESRTLNELLSAVGILAHVRPDSTMDTL